MISFWTVRQRHWFFFLLRKMGLERGWLFRQHLRRTVSVFIRILGKHSQAGRDSADRQMLHNFDTGEFHCIRVFKRTCLLMIVYPRTIMCVEFFNARIRVIAVVTFDNGRCTCRTGWYRKNGNYERFGKSYRDDGLRLQLLRTNELQGEFRVYRFIQLHYRTIIYFSVQH